MNTIARTALTATVITIAAATAPLAANAATPTAAVVAHTSTARAAQHPTITTTASCGELHVTLKGYAPQPNSNTVVATLDGTKVVNHSFATTYSFTFYADSTSSHSVAIKATQRGGHTATKTVTMKACTYAS